MRAAIVLLIALAAAAPAAAQNLSGRANALQAQTAADIANLGMLMNEAGQADAGAALLRQALAIYENTSGPNSEEARLVRGQLGK